MRAGLQQNQPLTTTPRVPTVQEVANEIMKKLSVNQRPPLRIEPLRQKAVYLNNQTQQQNINQKTRIPTNAQGLEMVQH